MLSNVSRLRTLWLVSLLIGALGFVLSLLWISSAQGPGLDWIWGIAAFGIAAIIYNIAFFALCSIFVPGLSKYVEDDTEVEGDTVTHVVKHTETGDQQIDGYIRAYAAARGITAVAIVTGLMIAAALTFF